MDVTDCVLSSGNMEYYGNRLKTDTYTKQMLPDKFELARAVLYYTGKSDICECFRCHVKLSSWERDDDAINEHIKRACHKPLSFRWKLQNFSFE